MKKILLTTVMLSALIAGAIPTAAHYDSSSTGLVCGVADPSAFQLTQNWMETVSASGEATLTCHLPSSLVPRPGAALAHADINGKFCTFRLGYNCGVDSIGNCVQQKCTSIFCTDSACKTQNCAPKTGCGP